MIKDDCKHLTLAQVERLIERDGLGKNCEYSIEALNARRFELLNDQAQALGNEWDNVDPALYKSSDALLIESVLETMTVTELATILRCSKQAVSLWRNERRKLPALEKFIIQSVIENNTMRKFFLK